MSPLPYYQDRARQARLARKGRDAWKQRCADKQDEIRYLRVRIRDLEASRQRWKDEALQARAPRHAQPTTPDTAEHDLGGARARRRSCNSR